MVERWSPRVVIADDQPLMREAIRSILEADGIIVVADVGDGRAAIDACALQAPDAVLMDVRMPLLDGISATAQLGAHGSGTRVLMLTTFDDDETLFGALQAGATGFMVKNSPPEDLQQAVRSVSCGESVLDPSVLTRVMRRFAQPTSARHDGEQLAQGRATRQVDQLTERERDVLFLLARGLSNVEIAARLNIAEATTKTHVSHVILKLGVRDRVQAVIDAYTSGFANVPRTVQARKAVGP